MRGGKKGDGRGKKDGKQTTALVDNKPRHDRLYGRGVLFQVGNTVISPSRSLPWSQRFEIRFQLRRDDETCDGSLLP